MKKSSLLVLASTTACLSINAREWTDIEGRKVHADIVSVYSATRTARMKGPSGKIFNVPFEHFSEADRYYLEHYAKGYYMPPIELNYSAVPELQPWGEKGIEIMKEWYPRISELLHSDNFIPPKKIKLTINNSEKGIAGAAGSNIGIASGWIKKHPDDVGVLIHELVHVVQGYGSGGVFWLNEGIADYIRWGLYEKKPLTWFHVPRNGDQDYRAGYQIAAGFMYWLETERSPSIMKPLSAAMRGRTYNDQLFKEITGNTVDELWDEYCKFRGV